MVAMTRGRWWTVAGGALVAAVAVVALVLASGGGPGDTGATDAPATTPEPAPTPSPPPEPTGSTDPPGTTHVPTTNAAPTAVPPELRGQDLTALPTSDRVVALTFDAGGDSAGLASILRTLADEGVPATFFLTGEWAAANAAGVADVRAAGHATGNHSVTHPHLPALSDAAIRDEVLGAQRLIEAAGGDPLPVFRFPFGDRDDRTIAAVNDLGFVAVRWTVDTLGWQGTSGGRSVQTVTERTLAALQPGEIVLMHVGAHPDDGSTLDADALPGIIERIRSAGYGFVTLGSLAGH